MDAIDREFDSNDVPVHLPTIQGGTCIEKGKRGISHQTPKRNLLQMHRTRWCEHLYLRLDFEGPIRMATERPRICAISGLLGIVFFL